MAEKLRILPHVPGLFGFRRPPEAREVKADEADPVGNAGLNIVIHPKVRPPALEENRRGFRVFGACKGIGHREAVHINRHLY